MWSIIGNPLPKTSGLAKTIAISMSKAASLSKWPFVTRLLGLGLDAALVYSPTGTRAARRGKDFGIRREDEDVGGLPEATGSPLMRSGSHKALTPPCQSVSIAQPGEDMVLRACLTI
jgi:hypothetical protein